MGWLLLSFCTFSFHWRRLVVLELLLPFSLLAAGRCCWSDNTSNDDDELFRLWREQALIAAVVAFVVVDVQSSYRRRFVNFDRSAVAGGDKLSLIFLQEYYDCSSTFREIRLGGSFPHSEPKPPCVVKPRISQTSRLLGVRSLLCN